MRCVGACKCFFPPHPSIHPLSSHPPPPLRGHPAVTRPLQRLHSGQESRRINSIHRPRDTRSNNQQLGLTLSDFSNRRWVPVRVVTTYLARFDVSRGFLKSSGLMRHDLARTHAIQRTVASPQKMQKLMVKTRPTN